ncbi:GNAT family N-acetyltransferase [Anaerosporobacter faecicola]|uniref:GNAT family N-acetyltransferase n=1 Tax=Anaerosporobacter faecicola TaxID=2718714 RepID=UPI001439307B|nr:GNAT family N-acetyltransferase [Anaerosporobacter faecicola]
MRMLNKSKYNRIRQLLTVNNKYLPLLEDFILQKKEADIFVDNENEPRAALVISKTNWTYLIGEAREEILKEALELLQKEKKEFYYWFGMSSEQLNKFSREIEAFELGDFPRYMFQFQKNKFLNLPKRITKYQLVEINQANIEEAMRFDSSIEAFYGTKEAFLEKGFGFVLYNGQKMIGQVISAGISTEGDVEIDISTESEYRGMGLGFNMGVAFIERCLEKKLVPKWDCMVSNEASKRLALRLGFDVMKEYPVTYLVTKKEF